MNISKKHLKHQAYIVGQMSIDEYRMFALQHFEVARNFDSMILKYKHSYESGVLHGLTRAFKR